MSVGKIVTGFSKPYVAKYSASGSTISYSSGQLLSQGVSISGSADQAEDRRRVFYSGGYFRGQAHGRGILFPDA